MILKLLIKRIDGNPSKQSNILPDVVVSSNIVFPSIDIDSLGIGILSVVVDFFSDVGVATLYDIYHYDAINF